MVACAGTLLCSVGTQELLVLDMQLVALVLILRKTFVTGSFWYFAYEGGRELRLLVRSSVSCLWLSVVAICRCKMQCSVYRNKIHTHVYYTTSVDGEWGHDFEGCFRS